MTHPTGWPYWIHAARLLIVALVGAALMVHALINARAPGAPAPGARKWAYALFALMFLCMTVANLVSFGRTLTFQAHVKVGDFHIGLFSLLVFGAYIPLLAKFRRPRI